MATSYLHPGVYVEEVPSAVRPIAGAGTSTAAFLGVVPDVIPLAMVRNATIGVGDGTTKVFRLSSGTVSTTASSFEFRVAGAVDNTAKVVANTATGGADVTFDKAPAAGARIRGDYTPQFTPAPPGELHLCTAFSDYTEAFGSFSTDAGHRNLTHAVYGFFANGGSRCFVGRDKAAGDMATSTLAHLEAVDEVAIVAAPGIVDKGAAAAIVAHCAVRTQDRFAILDLPQDLGTGSRPDLTLLSYDTQNNVLPQASDYAAVYFPWLQVDDPATGAPAYVPPSGHVAGIYARVDGTRGVHKSPANEAIMGITGLRYLIGDAQQDGINPQGVNAIRMLDGAPLVWGARTLGGDENDEWRYIAVRRLFLFLRKSIYRGTGWVVFEPNDASLWAKIVRNVSAFLINVWRDGALFGETPAKAFYVKCDAETNPPSVREAGQVITEIGVAVVEPAEFVIFRISQWAQPVG
jgi:Bacteriophage tail sheath protein